MKVHSILFISFLFLGNVGVAKAEATDQASRIKSIITDSIKNKANNNCQEQGGVKSVFAQSWTVSYQKSSDTATINLGGAAFQCSDTQVFSCNNNPLNNGKPFTFGDASAFDQSLSDIMISCYIPPISN